MSRPPSESEHTLAEWVDGYLAPPPPALPFSHDADAVLGTAAELVGFISGRPVAERDGAAADELIAVPRFEEAATARDREKQLLRLREEKAREWVSKVDVLTLMEEVEALRAEVDRLLTQDD